MTTNTSVAPRASSTDLSESITSGSAHRKKKMMAAVIPVLGLILALGAVYSHVLTGIQRSVAGGGKVGRFCGDGGWTDCSRTLGSTYSTVMGLPVTVYGAAWFAFLLALLVGGLVRKHPQRSLCRMLFRAILPGVGVTLVYAGISALVLHTFCFYCAGLYLLVGLSAALAFAGMGASREARHRIEANGPKDPETKGLPENSQRSFGPWSLRPSISPSLFLSVSRFLRIWALPGMVFLGVIFAERAMHGPPVPRVSLPAPANVGLHSEKLAALPRLGSAQATLRIVKFTDFRCSACRFSARELHRFMSKHPGEVELRCVNIPVRHMKPGQNLSTPECLAARVGIVMQKRGKFWPYYEGIYSNEQPENDEPLVRAMVAHIVGQDHVSEVFSEAESAETLAALASNIALARSYNVERTPSLIINDRMEIGALDGKEWETQLTNARSGGSPVVKSPTNHANERQ